MPACTIVVCNGGKEHLQADKEILNSHGHTLFVVRGPARVVFNRTQREENTNYNRLPEREKHHRLDGNKFCKGTNSC